MDSQETSDLGSSSSSSNEKASCTRMTTAVLMTKMTTDPHRFIRANASAGPTKTPPSASKSPGPSRRQQEETTQRWDDDGSTEWKDSFSNWIGKRKSLNANSVVSALENPSDFVTTPDLGKRANDSETARNKPTWKVAPDWTEEEEDFWRRKGQPVVSSVSKSVAPASLSSPADSPSHAAAQENKPDTLSSTEEPQVATRATTNSASPKHSRPQIRPTNTTSPTPAPTTPSKVALTPRTNEAQPDEQSDERCLSVRDALKKYTAAAPSSTPVVPPPARPKPVVPANRLPPSKPIEVNNSQPQPTRMQSAQEAEHGQPQPTRMQSAQEAEHGQPQPTRTQSAQEAERGVVEMDELTGLRKVSQFLNAVQHDTYYPSAPTPNYSDDYRPSASPQRDNSSDIAPPEDHSTNGTSTSPGANEDADSSGIAEADQGEEDQDKVVGSVSADQTCAGCNKQLEAGAAMYIEKLRSVFHIHCFRCSVCRDSLVIRQRCVNREYGDEDDDDDLQLGAETLTTVTVFIRDSKLLCGACFERLPKLQSPAH